MNNKKDTRLKVLSLLVAIVMWTFVVNSTNPTLNKTFRGIPVIIKNQDTLEDAGYTIIGGQENHTASIKLKGTRERLVGLKSTDIYASVDIAEMSEGVQSVQIDVDTPTGITVDEIEPDHINLNIQKVIKKTLPVNLVISDEIKDGRIVETNELSPNKVEVKGPASAINKVDRAEVRIEDTNLIDGKVHNVVVNVLDRNGEPVTDIDVSTNDVNLSFRVYETKRVPVRIFTSGTIDSAYEEVSRNVFPDTVVLIGPESVMRDIEEVSTKPINIISIKQSVSGDIKLDLPDSVEVYNGENKVNYKIEVKKKPSTRPSPISTTKSTTTTTDTKEKEDNEDGR